MTMEQPDLSSWVGRHLSAVAPIDSDHVRKIALTLNAPTPNDGDVLPALWQWAFFTDSVSTQELGTDGHPPVGGFLPPSQGRNRMWAGGRVDFHAPLIVGKTLRKTSTVMAVKEKTGRTGSLMFVTVKHEYTQDGVVAIAEEQDIVYRAPSAPKLTGSDDAPEAQWSEDIVPTSTMLFRFSAVTFNTHRIHYDYPYVTAEEGYPGLVVHGPMIAIYMLHAFQHAHPEKSVARFAYRGLRPLFSPTPFQVAGRIVKDNEAQAWAQESGTLAHQAEITFR
jgi:itaconyl-CoA hydratase/mesaconyl-C4 CoA hydratase